LNEGIQEKSTGEGWRRKKNEGFEKKRTREEYSQEQQTIAAELRRFNIEKERKRQNLNQS